MQLVKWFLFFPLLLGMGQASEVFVDTKDGQTYVLDVDPEESLMMIEERISALTEENAFIVALPSRNHRTSSLKASHRGGYLGYPRDYSAEVTPCEKNDIRYIVTSLADKPLVTITFIKGDLESAGDRIDHLHPLRFLMTVFTDEEMKVGVRNIRGRGWIWNQFIGGIKESLSTEAHIGNLRNEQIIHFAQTVELDVNAIYPSLQAGDWDAFIETLIREIPRKGYHDRYEN